MTQFFVSVTIAVAALQISIGTANAAQGLSCAALFGPRRLAPTTAITPPGFGAAREIDDAVRVKGAAWRARIERAESERNFVTIAQILNEVSNLAGELIRRHRSQDFFELYRSVQFPINKHRYEDLDHFFPYGRHLLEDAILSKNFAIYDWLRTQPNERARIAVWNRALTEIVVASPYFSKDVLTIPTQSGRYDGRLMNVGYMTERRIESLKEIQRTGDIQALFLALEDLLPSGEVNVLGIHGNEPKKTNALLEFAVPCHCGVGSIEDLSVKGEDEISERWLQMRIYDSRFYKQGWLHGRYTQKVAFNLQLVKHLQSKTSFGVGPRVPLDQRETNWINELEILPGRIRVLIERDKVGTYYDRGTRFQELTLIYSPRTARIESVQISNGDNRLFGKKIGWKTQTVEIPETTKSFSGVYFHGYEDLATQELTPRAPVK